MKKQKKVLRDQQRQAREERAEQRKLLEEDDAWGDAQRLYRDCAALLATMGPQLMEVIAIPGLLERIDDPAQFQDDLQLLQKDLTDLSGRLSALYAQHANRTGSAVNPDDFVKSLEICQQYVQFASVFQLSLQPVWNKLLEQTNRAEVRLLRELQAQEQAQNPDDTRPIDAEIKEASVSLEVTTEVKEDGTEEFVSVEKVDKATFGRTMTHVDLDPADPDPQATVEAVLKEHKPLRGHTSPIIQIDEIGVFNSTLQPSDTDASIQPSSAA